MLHCRPSIGIFSPASGCPELHVGATEATTSAILIQIILMPSPRYILVGSSCVRRSGKKAWRWPYRRLLALSETLLSGLLPGNRVPLVLKCERRPRPEVASKHLWSSLGAEHNVVECTASSASKKERSVTTGESRRMPMSIMTANRYWMHWCS
jgi:hypothetical protein